MEIDHTEQPEHALPSFSIIIEIENLAWHRDAESLLRLVSEYTYKPLRRLPALLADNPKCIVYLPLATVMSLLSRPVAHRVFPESGQR